MLTERHEGFVAMQRLALALIAVGIVFGLIALGVRAIAGAVRTTGASSAVATGDNMQKAAFFLLLCLIMYVSLTGAS
jgi:hypothetical protein